MYYGVEGFPQAYKQLIESSSCQPSCQLVIFTSCASVDALCATRMLHQLFRKQLVQSQIVPVFGFAELQNHYEHLDVNVKSILLVGFGAMVDIESYLGINAIDGDDTAQSLQKRNIYVLDGHRPWNLDNVFGSDVIKCLDDGTVEETLDREKRAYLELLELEKELADGESDDDDRTQNSDTDKDSEGEQDDEDDDLNVHMPGAKRSATEPKSPKTSKRQKKQLFQQNEQILEEYYTQGTTVVTSVAMQVYSLISSIGETSLHYLWLAILGATSLDTTHSLVYYRLFSILKDEVKRLAPANSTTYSNRTPDTLSLDIQPDYHLFLLRHSSLYDSFYYSNYVNAKLSVWNENGKKRLHKMFARMGIPLTAAQESWLYMDNSIKRELRVIFDRNLDRYGLQDIVRDGFVRTYGFRGTISASEVVEALTALLEVGTSMNVDLDGLDESADDPDRSTVHSKNAQIMRKKWISNFWTSWDALNDHKDDQLNLGIRHAKSLQKAIFNTGVTILEKRLIKHLRIYRLCVLQDGPDLELYRNPLTLLRLGNWLIECCAESEDKQLLPMVLACLNEQTNTYLVAGMAARYPRGLQDTLKYAQKPILNNFTMAFQQITAQTGAKVKIDNFESAIIEVYKEDLSPFLEKLTLSGLV